MRQKRAVFNGPPAAGISTRGEIAKNRPRTWDPAGVGKKFFHQTVPKDLGARIGGTMSLCSIPHPKNWVPKKKSRWFPGKNPSGKDCPIDQPRSKEQPSQTSKKLPPKAGSTLRSPSRSGGFLPQRKRMPSREFKKKGRKMNPRNHGWTAHSNPSNGTNQTSG